MVILRHPRPWHWHRGTSVAFKRRVHIGQTEIKKGQARDAVEDQRRSEKAVGRRVPQSGQVSLIGGQHSFGPKKDGKVWMCVDYRDLNTASPKDNFPLPHIDTLVDNTARHFLFSFMDGFSGYNQIRIALEDMEKTTFLTMWGTFCYKVMPFRLKNSRATY